jgi:hypothetical protein
VIEKQMAGLSPHRQGNKGTITMDMILAIIVHTTQWRNQGGCLLKLTNKDRLGVVDTVAGHTRDTKVGLVDTHHHTRDTKVGLVDTHQGKGKQHRKLSRQLPRLLHQPFNPQKRNQPHGINLL